MFDWSDVAAIIILENPHLPNVESAGLVVLLVAESIFKYASCCSSATILQNCVNCINGVLAKLAHHIKRKWRKNWWESCWGRSHGPRSAHYFSNKPKEALGIICRCAQAPTGDCTQTSALVFGPVNAFIISVKDQNVQNNLQSTSLGSSNNTNTRMHSPRDASTWTNENVDLVCVCIFRSRNCVKYICWLLLRVSGGQTHLESK